MSKPTIFVVTDTTEMSRLLVTSITFSRLKDVQLPVKHVEMLKQSLELWSLAWQPPLLLLRPQLLNLLICKSDHKYVM